MKKTETYEFTATMNQHGQYECIGSPQLIFSENPFFTNKKGNYINQNLDSNQIFFDVYSQNMKNGYQADINHAYQDMINLQKIILGKMKF